MNTSILYTGKYMNNHKQSIDDLRYINKLINMCMEISLFASILFEIENMLATNAERMSVMAKMC